MIDFLTQNVIWWYWIIFGISLIIAEMVTGTFITLGFGVAAILVGLLDLIATPNIVMQIGLWLVLSVMIITFLFKYFKGQSTVSSSGQSDHGFDTLGTVTQAIEKHGRGKVKFDTPVLGNTLWHATSEEDLSIGQRVAITEVNGQLIKVAKIHSSIN